MSSVADRRPSNHTLEDLIENAFMDDFNMPVANRDALVAELRLLRACKAALEYYAEVGNWSLGHHYDYGDGYVWNDKGHNYANTEFDTPGPNWEDGWEGARRVLDGQPLVPPAKEQS